METRRSDQKSSFTKFGIWDKEVNQFINDLAAERGVDKQSITDWMYRDGVMLVQKHKSELNKLDHYKDANGKTSETSEYQILGETIIAFNHLVVECLTRFITDEDRKAELMAGCVSEFIADVQASHYKFYKVQAYVLTSLNKFLDVNPNTSREDIYDCTVDLFNQAKATAECYEFEDTIAEIDNHLQFMAEFLLYATGSKPGMVSKGFFQHPLPQIVNLPKKPDVDPSAKPHPLG